MCEEPNWSGVGCVQDAKRRREEKNWAKSGMIAGGGVTREGRHDRPSPPCTVRHKYLLSGRYDVRVSPGQLGHACMPLCGDTSEKEHCQTGRRGVDRERRR